MELESANSSNNDLANAGQSNGRGSRAAQSADQTSPKAAGDENEVELDVNSPKAKGENGNPDQNHCARNFFCWCCSCCSCLK